MLVYYTALLGMAAVRIRKSARDRECGEVRAILFTAVLAAAAGAVYYMTGN